MLAHKQDDLQHFVLCRLDIHHSAEAGRKAHPLFSMQQQLTTFALRSLYLLESKPGMRRSAEDHAVTLASGFLFQVHSEGSIASLPHIYTYIYIYADINMYTGNTKLSIASG